MKFQWPEWEKMVSIFKLFTPTRNLVHVHKIKAKFNFSFSDFEMSFPNVIDRGMDTSTTTETTGTTDEPATTTEHDHFLHLVDSQIQNGIVGSSQTRPSEGNTEDHNH